MGLWQRIKRLLPVAGLVATTVYIGATRPTERLFGSTPAEREETAQRVRKQAIPWLLGGTVASLAALVAAHAVKRARGSKPTFLQPAVEHPVMTGSVLGTAYGLSTAVFAQSIETAPYALLPAAALGAVGYAGALMLQQYKPPYVLHWVQNTCDLARWYCTRDLAEKQAILERMRPSMARPARTDLDIIDILFAQRKVDAACALLKEALPRFDETLSTTAFEHAFVLPGAEEISPRRQHFERMFFQLRQGNVYDVVSTLDDFVQQNKGLDAQAAHSYALQSLSDMMPALQRSVPHYTEATPLLEARATHSWQTTVAGVLAHPQREQQFKKVGESRNEVLEYASSEFLQGLLVFKRCDATQGACLARERHRILALRELYGDRIVQSLALVEHDGKTYHVLRHGTNTTLEDVLRNGTEGQRFTALRETTEFLAALHRYTPAEREPSPQGSWWYQNRLATVFCDELKKQAIAVPASAYRALDATSHFIYAGLKDAPLGFYKDANPRNWLVEKDRIVAIDFEHNILLPVQLDLVSLLEFGPAPARTHEVQIMLKHYFEVAKQNVSFDAFVTQYKHAALQRHLEFCGYRARDKEPGAVAFHLERAKNYARELQCDSLADALGDITL